MRIVWTAEERILSYYGVLCPDTAYDLPSDIAESLIHQGLATEETIRDSVPEKKNKNHQKSRVFNLDLEE